MKKAIKTAHKLYDMGLTVAQIMQATDLTTDQLAKIGIHGSRATSTGMGGQRVHRIRLSQWTERN
jgi:galactokinase